MMAALTALAGSTNKKVVVSRFDREPISGFVNPQTYLQSSGVEVLSLAGALALIPYEEVKVVYFVRDFGPVELSAERRLFNTRPKTSGIWVRMRFRDGELMDGLMSNNLLQLDPYGFTLVPANPSSNNQRVFIPRVALGELQVVGVVGGPLRPPKPKPKPKEQIELFE
jgi:hypothetical protein